MNKLLALAALAEGATGVTLLVVSSVEARLLLGAELTGVAITVGRVAIESCRHSTKDAAFAYRH